MTSSENNDIPAVNSLKISRGMREEAEIDWEELVKLFVFDQMGNKIMFTDIFKKEKTICFFVRVSSL